MHFALLLSQLPHVDDARAQYGDMFVVAGQPHRVRNMALTMWAMVSKVVS